MSEKLENLTTEQFDFLEKYHTSLIRLSRSRVDRLDQLLKNYRTLYCSKFEKDQDEFHVDYFQFQQDLCKQYL